MGEKPHIRLIYGAKPLLDREAAVTEDDLLVFIDALRASNTILAALNIGVKYIRIFSNLREIRNFKKKDKEFMLIGEKACNNIEGFDYNNSPTQLLHDRRNLCGRKMAMITSNFTKVVEAVKEIRCTKVVGSLLNAKALRDFLLARVLFYNRIFLLAVGKNGKRTVEDDVTAEFLRSFLTGGYVRGLDRINKIYHRCASGKSLRAKGYSKDIDFCLLANSINAVPQIKNGKIFLKFDSRKIHYEKAYAGNMD